MNSDFSTTIIGGAICLALSAAGIYYIMNSLDQQMESNVQKQMDSSSYGPLDDAMADLAGVPRKPKPKLILPKAKPINLDFKSQLPQKKKPFSLR